MKPNSKKKCKKLQSIYNSKGLSIFDGGMSEVLRHIKRIERSIGSRTEHARQLVRCFVDGEIDQMFEQGCLIQSDVPGASTLPPASNIVPDDNAYDITNEGQPSSTGVDEFIVGSKWVSQKHGVGEIVHTDGDTFILRFRKGTLS